MCSCQYLFYMYWKTNHDFKGSSEMKSMKKSNAGPDHIALKSLIVNQKNMSVHSVALM